MDDVATVESLSACTQCWTARAPRFDDTSLAREGIVSWTAKIFGSAWSRLASWRGAAVLVTGIALLTTQHTSRRCDSDFGWHALRGQRSYGSDRRSPADTPRHRIL